MRGCLYRLAIALLPPLLLFGGLELGLRVVGYGVPPRLFVEAGAAGRAAANPRFGERFFPPGLAREPVAQELAWRQPEGALRIVVLGGSAAMGTPEPGFHFGRQLEVILERRHPGLEVEVVNAAMAAIDSRVVREIAREVGRLEPDLLLVYAGNNEVVGPFGPGSVLGATAPEAWIRTRLALGRLRVTQLVRELAAPLRRRAPAEWRGMEMFVERLVAADDPRLEGVRRRLGANLEAVARTAQRVDARLVLATVAVNLRDSPPFAALHRDGLSAVERRRFAELLGAADSALADGAAGEALELLERAAAIDDVPAGLWFRRGRALLAAGKPGAAEAFARARDLDALRFRADSGINDAIRATASRLGIPRVDAERALAAAPESAGGIPGGALFWEHVHLRFAGNYRLALAFLPVVERLQGLASPAGPPPSAAAVARALARTAFDRHAEAAAIYALVRRPPFTGQAGHHERLAALRLATSELALRARRERAADAELYRAALAERPGDLRIRERYAAFLAATGAPRLAVREWRLALDRLPGNAGWRTRLGFALADAGELRAAESELRRVDAMRPGPDAWVNLGVVVARAGREGEAERLYRRALERRPGHAEAAVNLAALLERESRGGEAEELLRGIAGEELAPLAVRIALAELWDRQGRLADAVAGYERALEVDPFEPRVLNNLGYALERLGRLEQAARRYAAAIDADPGHALAHLNLADLLLAAGRPAAAVPLYEAGLRLEPGNAQAAINLERARRAVGGDRPPGS